MTRIRAGVADSISGLSGRSSACRTGAVLALALDAAQIATVEFEKMGGGEEREGCGVEAQDAASVSAAASSPLITVSTSELVGTVFFLAACIKKLVHNFESGSTPRAAQSRQSHSLLAPGHVDKCIRMSRIDFRVGATVRAEESCTRCGPPLAA